MSLAVRAPEDLVQVGVGGQQLVLGGPGCQVGELGRQGVGLRGLGGQRVAPDAVGRAEQVAVVAGHPVDGLVALVEQAAVLLGQVVVLGGQLVELGHGDLVLLQRLGLLEQQVADDRRAVRALDLGLGLGLLEGLEALIAGNFFRCSGPK